MAFNTKRFLNDFNIQFKEQGANTSEEFLNIDCVFCSDHSQHLGVHRTNKYCSCWKCGKHTMWDLVKKLLPHEDTKEIMDQYETSGTIQRKINKKEDRIIPKSIKVPGKALLKRHKSYLNKRGYNADYLEKKYKLTGTDHMGEYKHRILTPIFYNNSIVSYQGRDITDKQAARYKACKKENEIMHHKNLLFNIDNCQKDYIVVTEGTMKVFRLGDNSCCTFGREYTIQQLRLLSKYKIVYVFFDPDKPGQLAAEKLCKDLDLLGVDTFNIHNEIAPDDMDQKDADAFMRTLKH